MASPTKYTISYSFGGFQATNPRSPLPGTSLDGEFASIEASIDEIVDALGDIRRSDGSLNNGIVGPHSLSPALSNNFRPRGEWSSDGREYNPGDGVFHEGYFYVSETQHASGEDSEPGVDTETWTVQFALATAVGNMLVSVYDPDFKEANVYDVDNHEDGTSNKVFTAAEKTKLAGIEAAATASPYLPAGVYVPYAGSALPSGWLWCDGSAVSRTTYATLFAAIGTTFGAGNGATTFNLPDMRGRAPFGRDDMGGSAASRVTTSGGGVAGTTLGAVGGAESVTLTVAQIPSHDHGGTTSVDPGHQHLFQRMQAGALTDGLPSIGGYAKDTLEQAITDASGAHAHTITAQGDGQSHSNMPPALICNYIIKT